jgi:alpha-L-fucosidase
MYNYVRSLKPDIIVNNRVDKGREGMAGMTAEGGFMGDFGTPEQEIPSTGLPGTDWESCMTMNDHWGYNKQDNNWKSSKDLIRKLIDIASKGGNFLLNVGPTAEGLFPEESKSRLEDIGAWMQKYGESIYGTLASPFKFLKFGRCTQKPAGRNTRLYFHVFDWPAHNQLIIPGLDNKVKRVIHTGTGQRLPFQQKEGEIFIDLNGISNDAYATVITVEIKGNPVVFDPPEIIAPTAIFIDSLIVRIEGNPEGTEIRYSRDGRIPDAYTGLYSEPIVLKESQHLIAKIFRDGIPLSGRSDMRFEKVGPNPACTGENIREGFKYFYYEGDWNSLPDFDLLKSIRSGYSDSIQPSLKMRDEYYGFVFDGFMELDKDGVYIISLESDDGSRLTIDDQYIIDNDGLHGMLEKSMTIPLAKGYHKLKVEYFEKTGYDDLKVNWKLINP